MTYQQAHDELEKHGFTPESAGPGWARLKHPSGADAFIVTDRIEDSILHNADSVEKALTKLALRHCP